MFHPEFSNNWLVIFFVSYLFLLRKESVNLHEVLDQSFGQGRKAKSENLCFYFYLAFPRSLSLCWAPVWLVEAGSATFDYFSLIQYLTPTEYIVLSSHTQRQGTTISHHSHQVGRPWVLTFERSKEWKGFYPSWISVNVDVKQLEVFSRTETQQL